MGIQKVLAADRAARARITRSGTTPVGDIQRGSSDAALRAINTTRGQADRLLTAAPEGALSSGELRELEQIQEKGFLEQAGSGLMNLFNFIDRPRKLVGLAVRDIFGMDSRRGTEIKAGSYWDALRGDNEKLVDDLGEDLVGEGGNLGTSQLLDDVWEYDESMPLWAKSLRFAASLTGDVALDPTTYLTAGFSAVGKKAALASGEAAVRQAAARAAVRMFDEKGLVASTSLLKLGKEAATEGAETAMERTILEGAQRRVQGRIDELVTELGEDVSEEAIQASTARAIRDSIGLDEFDELAETIVGGELGSAASILTEVQKRIATKTFGKGIKGFDDEIWDQYTQHVVTRRGGEALGDAFTTGGLRLTSPLGKHQSRPILQGSGRKIRETITRKPVSTKTARRLQQRAEHWAAKLDADAPILGAKKRAAKASRLAAASRGDATILRFNAAERVASRVGRQFANTTTGAAQGMDELAKVARKAGMNDQEFRDVNVALLHAMQRDGAFDPEMLAILPASVVEKMREIEPALRGALDDAWSVANEVIPGGVKHLEGYVPFQIARPFRKAMSEIIEQEQQLVLPQTLEQAQALAARLGDEVSVEDIAMFAEVQAALSPKIAGANDITWANEFNRRTTGVSTRTTGQDIVALDDNLLMFGGTAVTDVNSINASLMRVFNGLVEAGDLPIKLSTRGGKDKIPSALVQDPGEAIATYVGGVQAAAINSALVAEARRTGLIAQLDQVEKVDAIGVTLAEKPQAAVLELIDSTVNRANNQALRRAKKLQKTKTVSIGENTIEMPALLAEHKGVRQAVERAKKAERRVRNRQSTVDGARRQESLKLQNKYGLSEDQADQLVSLNSEALADLRQQMEVAAHETANELHEALDAAAKNAPNTAEVAEQQAVSRAEVEAFIDDSLAAMADLENQWADNFSEVGITPLLEDGTIDTVAATGILEDAILRPIRDGVRRHMEIRIGSVQDQLDASYAKLDRAKQAAADPKGSTAYDVVPEMENIRIAELQDEMEFLISIRDGSAELQDFSTRVVVGSDRVDQRFGVAAYMELSADFQAGMAALGDARPRIRASAAQQWDVWSDVPRASSEVLDDPSVQQVLAIGRAVNEGADPQDILKSKDIERLLGDQYGSLRHEIQLNRNATQREARRLEHRVQADWVQQAETEASELLSRYNYLTPEEAAELVKMGAEGSPDIAPLRALSQIYNDPEAMDLVIARMDTLNEVVRRFVRGDAKLEIRVGPTGEPRLSVVLDKGTTRFLPADANTPTLSSMAEALERGAVQADALAGSLGADNLRVVQEFGRYRAAIGKAREDALKQGRVAASARLAEIDEGVQALDQLDRLLTSAMSGKTGSKRLQTWAFDEAGRPTAALKQVEKLFGDTEIGAVDSMRRLIEETIIATESKSPVAAKILKTNERKYADVLAAPVEQRVRTLENMVADLRSEAALAIDADKAEQFEAAAELVEAWSGLADYVSVKVDDFGRPITGGSRVVRFEQAAIDSRRKAVDDAVKNMNAPTKRERELVERIRKSLEPQTSFEGAAAGQKPAAAFGIPLEGEAVDEYLGLWLENITTQTKALHTPWGMNELRRSANELVSWWKSAATVSKPSFHVRNLISGVANGFIAGVGPNNYRRISAPLLTWRSAYKNGGPEAAVLAVRNRHGDEFADMFEAAFGEGVFQGFSRVEGLAQGGKRIRTKWDQVNLARRDNLAFRAGGNVMESFEDFLRMAAFDRHYSGLGTERLASEMVKAVHFDYTNLTNLETKFKKVAPFFVWTRRNLPLQLQAMIERPGMINVWNHVQRNVESEFGATGDPFALSPFSSGLATRLGENEEGEKPFWSRMIWDPDLPVNILDDIPFLTGAEGGSPIAFDMFNPIEWLKWSSNLLGPQVTLPMDMMEQEAYGDTVAPPLLNELLVAFDSMIDTELIETANGDAYIPRWQASLVRTAAPFFDEYRALLGVKPNDPIRAQREGYDPEDPGLVEGLLSGDVGGAAGAAQNALLRGARGLGFEFQTPQDTVSSSFNAQEIVKEVRQRLARQG